MLWFKKGLEAPGHAEDEYKALRYELGSAYQQMGEISRALEVFTEVYGVDVLPRRSRQAAKTPGAKAGTAGAKEEEEAEVVERKS